MIDFKDPLPPVLALLEAAEFNVYGNAFPANMPPEETALLVKPMGGRGFHRLQFLARSTSDISAMYELIEALNFFERNAGNMTGLRGTWAERESNPVHSVDADTKRPEAWAYVRLEALES